MKVFKQVPIVLIAVLLFTQSGLMAGKTKGRVKLPSLYKTTVEQTAQFDGNRVRDDMENNALIVSDYSGHSGLEWPKDNSTYTVYASAVWIAGIVDGNLRVAAGDYSNEFVPGPWGSEPSATANKFYKVNKSDLADPLTNDDFQNWPVEMGAPWVDVDGDSKYDPLPNGPDYPDFIGDQVVWYVANDGGAGSHGLFGTLPLGLEVQFTIFGFNRPDAFGDMMFVKALVINKGGNTIDSTFIGLWSDPDLGDAGDDFVGSDTTLSLGICYNDGVDGDFAGYSGGTPAVGYDFFQGPIVVSSGDTAKSFGRVIPGFKNLPMSSFVKYINPDPVYFDPNDATEVYNYMNGLTAAGSPFPFIATGGTNFVHAGDPAKDTGPNDTEYVDSDIHASGDRRFLMNAGPFTMADGDSQEVVFGIMNAAAGGPIESFEYLKEVDKLAQLAYDIDFALPASPKPPVVSYSTQGDEINLMWDTAQESYSVVSKVDPKPIVESVNEIVSYEPVADITTSYIYAIADTVNQKYDTLSTYDPNSSYDFPVVIVGTTNDTVFSMKKVVTYDTTYGTEPSTFNFEGYNVYQYETLSGSGNRKLVKTFDEANGVTDIVDLVFDRIRGENILVTTQHGTDSGVRNHFTFDRDYLNNGIPLKTNRVYYVAVTAYGYNKFGIPKTLESAPEIMAIRPSIPNTLEVGSKGEEDYTEDIDHSAGKSDGVVNVVVVDPLEVTGDDYQVYFTEQDFYFDSDGKWKAGSPPSAKISARISDVSPSIVSASAFVGKGQIKIDFNLTLSSPDFDYADGFKLTLPDGVKILSAKATSGSFNSSGQNPSWSATGTVSGQTIMWGNSSVSTWGAIEGNSVFTVVVEPFTPPISVGYILYSDGYGGNPVDAEGTVVIDSLQYETKTTVVWNVKDVTLSKDVVTNQTIISGEDRLTGDTYVPGDDAGWTKFDGLKVRVSGAPSHTVNSVTWDESGGEISPVFGTVELYTDSDNDGKYDFEEPFKDYGLDGFPNTLEPGYISKDDENLDPSGDDYDASSNPLGDEGNGVYNPWPGNGELFTDANSNGQWDWGEAFSDLGVDTLASIDEPGYQVRNLDPSGDDFYDLGEDNLADKDEAGYDAVTNPDPAGDNWADYGTDGTPDTKEAGYNQYTNPDPAGDDFRLFADTTKYYICDGDTSTSECDITDTVVDSFVVILAQNTTGSENNGFYDVGEGTQGNGVQEATEPGTEGNDTWDSNSTKEEPYTDENGNGQWDDAEPFVDTNYNRAYDAGYPEESTWMKWSYVGPFYQWWGGQSAIPGTAYPTVELRFVPMQSFTDVNGNGLYDSKEPYKWDTSDSDAGFADMYRTWGAEWTGFNPVPYTAWNMDTDPPTQLAIVQRDRDNNGQWDGVRSGNYNYIWITNVAYDGTSKFDDGDDDNDFMYQLIVVGADMPVYYTADLNVTSNMLARTGKITFVPARDNIVGDVFAFSTKGAVSKQYTAKNVKVWPNPYFGYNPEERTPVDQQMHFTHLPETGKYNIRIFDLAGNHIKTITGRDTGSQFAIWDLRNDFGIPVASGMYIVHVETSSGGDKILKLAVIQPEQRLDRY